MTDEALLKIFQEMAGRTWVKSPKWKYVKTPKFTPQKLSLTQSDRSAADFATYLIAQGIGAGSKDLALTQAGATVDEDEQSTLGKIFGWMSSLGSGVQNIAQDIYEGTPEDIPEHGLAAIAHLNRPGIELASIPGIQMPWEDKYNDFIKNSNVTRPDDDKKGGREVVMGAEILEDLLGIEGKGFGGKVAKYGGGFALDVLSDPTTYIPVAGLFKAGGAAAKGIQAATKSAPKALDETIFAPKLDLPKINSPIPPLGEALTGSRPLGAPIPGFKRVTYAPGTKPFVNPLGNPANDIAKAGQRIIEDPEQHMLMQKFMRSDNAKRAANVRHGKPIDFHELPEWTPRDSADFTDIMRDKKLAKAGKVTDGKGPISATGVERSIEAIAKGEIPRYTPSKTKPAVGESATIAKSAADKILESTVSAKSPVARRADINPANQANLYNRVYAATEDLAKTKFKGQVTTKKALEWRRAEARKMLRAAEDHLIRLGKAPVYWTGTKLRLSDVLDEVGISATDELPTRVMEAFASSSTKNIKDPGVKKAIETLLARRAVSAADLLQNLSKHAVRSKAEVLEGFTDTAAAQRMAHMVKGSEEVAKAMGLTKKEAIAARDLVANIVDIDKLPVESVLSSLGKELVESVLKGRTDADTIAKINKAIAEQHALTPANMARKVDDNTVVSTIMSRFSTYYGIPSIMKRVSDDVMLAGERLAYGRTSWMRRNARKFDRDAQNRAFAAVRYPSDYRAGLDPDEMFLADQMTEYFQHMFGDSRFMNTMDYTGTTAVKSQMVMNDMNKHLKAIGSTFEFTNRRGVTDFAGKTHDFSEKGVGWLDSWKLANPAKNGQDPVNFIHDIDQALQRTLAEYSLYDDFAMRFGARKGDAWFDPKVHTARLEGTRIGEWYFPEELRDGFMKLIHNNDQGLWRASGKPMRFYGRGLRIWKTQATIYFPSHHIRNMIGDLFLMWGAGHNSPDVFFKAARVLNTQRKRYKEALKANSLDPLDQLIGPDAMSIAMTKTDDIVMKVRGRSLTAEQLYIAANERGLLLSANSYEDIFGEAPLAIGNESKIRQALGDKTVQRLQEPFGGRAHHAASSVAEYREHYVRLSHFIAATRKNLKKRPGDLKAAFDDAAHEVRKWHPDGRDLTQFEQKLRYAIPFYSWTRKSIPLLVQIAAQRPAKVLAYPRGMTALQGMLGIETGGVTDPFPDDQLFPDWIRAYGIGPIGDPESENEFSAFWGNLGRNIKGPEGEPFGYTMLNPSNPFNDTVTMHAGMGKPKDFITGVSDSLTPFFNIPMDLARDKTFSGAPISTEEGGAGYKNYLLNAWPTFAGANRVAEIGKPQRAGVEDGKIQALINILSAAGLRGTGPYIKSAEYELDQKNRRASAK